jgi:GNAT superfamily N-acetyltransferase
MNKIESVHPPAIALRPARREDDEFLCSVYGSSRELELEQVPWSAEQREAFIRFQFEAQRQHYQTEYPEAEHQIILINGQPVGRLYVDRRATEIRIMDITLLTASRGQGAGARLIEGLMEEARQSRKRLTIYIESFNRSRRLFERLGFNVVEQDGFLLLFEWRPTDTSD